MLGSHENNNLALMPVSPSPERAAVLIKLIRFIVAFTIAYNFIEAIVSLWAGKDASSSALIGFGLDSTIEVTSALAVAWQFSRPDPQRYEKVTLKIIAVAFFALAAYVTVDSLLTLLHREPPSSSAMGIIIAVLSVVIMPTVSFLERRAGIELGSASAIADSKQTLVCAWLSVALLIGLVLNAAVGWWWADPVAALVIAVLAFREGKEAWEGDSCALATGRALDPQANQEDDCCSSQGCCSAEN
jgi:hypothetical protein